MIFGFYFKYTRLCSGRRRMASKYILPASFKAGINKALIINHEHFFYVHAKIYWLVVLYAEIWQMYLRMTPIPEWQGWFRVDS